MWRPRPGWLVALFAAVVGVSCWLPWLTTDANGGGHASAVAGRVGALMMPRLGPGQLMVLLASTLIVAGAMTARGLSPRIAAAAALVISLAVLVLAVGYYYVYVHPPMSAAYGLYIGTVAAAAAVGCSVWALIMSRSAGRARP